MLDTRLPFPGKNFRQASDLAVDMRDRPEPNATRLTNLSQRKPLSIDIHQLMQPHQTGTGICRKRPLSLYSSTA
jgi:hypothetical protein